MQKCLLVLVLICAFTQCQRENLQFKINVPMNDARLKTLDKVFQDAYLRFLQFLQEMDKVHAAFASKRIKDFRLLTLDSFGIIKGRTVNTLDELQDAMGLFSPAIGIAISAGVCAVGELMMANERALVRKLLTALEKFESAQEIAANFKRMSQK